MAWPSATELEDLVARFRARALPKAEWTHRAHLAVGAWHVARHGAAGALRRLRRRIRRLNDTHGTPNTETGGYHETVTRAYVALIAQFLSHCPAASALDECVRALLASPLAAGDALLVYYSRDRLMSVEARRGWIEPDRQRLGLPELPTGRPEQPMRSGGPGASRIDGAPWLKPCDTARENRGR